jgi:hypothetical protein
MLRVRAFIVQIRNVCNPCLQFGRDGRQQFDTELLRMRHADFDGRVELTLPCERTDVQFKELAARLQIRNVRQCIFDAQLRVAETRQKEQALHQFEVESDGRGVGGGPHAVSHT